MTAYYDTLIVTFSDPGACGGMAQKIYPHCRNERILKVWRYTIPPTGDYVSGYIRDLQSVGISVHDYDLWTEETRPIAERTLEHIRQSMNV